MDFMMLYSRRYNSSKIWDSTVSIETGYRLDDQGIRIRGLMGTKSFHFSIPSRLALEFTQPPVQREYQRPFPGGKAAGA
jgi:hypothetical protein